MRNLASGVKGLFINNKKAQDSIHESGKMVFNCLKLSVKHTIDYVEISEDNRQIPIGYQFFFFNYHPSTMAWLDTAQLRKLPGVVITMVLEVLPNDPFVMCPDNHFDSYCVLDPTLKVRNKKVFAFPRPLDTDISVVKYVQKDKPVIGSFGFATKGKGFQHVIEAVNKEFDEAIVKINIPFGDFVPESEKYANYLGELCVQRAKAGIEVIISHDYMSKAELIDWCSQNTLNCFLYDRNIPGLAATTDQAIVSGRPLSVSKNDTFRHILSYLPPYPTMTLKEAIGKSTAAVEQMRLDWSPVNFARKFDDMINLLLSRHAITKSNNASFVLPILEPTISNKIAKRIRKYKRYLAFNKLRQFIFKRRKLKDEELI
ncbi:MAG: hypothetical protein ABI683_12905 [Ginsengibacter sp.]